MKRMKRMKQVSSRLIICVGLCFGLPLAVIGQQPAVADIQSQLNEQAAEIAALREALEGKVDNGTSRNSVNLNGRIHADYWGFPNHDSVIDTL